MSYVMISHKVASYAKWKRAVQSHKKSRQAAGEKCFYVCRDSKKPNDLMVWCEWDSAARMKKFMASAELHKAMEDAGVLGQPEVAFFNKMEDLSV